MAVPPGGEDVAGRFYGGVLAMVEVDKPPVLAAAAGAGSAAVAAVHLGVEALVFAVVQASPSPPCSLTVKASNPCVPTASTAFLKPQHVVELNGREVQQDSIGEHETERAAAIIGGHIEQPGLAWRR